jgi:hypothetical protein
MKNRVYKIQKNFLYKLEKGIQSEPLIKGSDKTKMLSCYIFADLVKKN